LSNINPGEGNTEDLKAMKRFWMVKDLSEIYHLEICSAMIELKGVRMWTGFIWLRIVPSVMLL
jgi:hypothetical protein